MQEDRAMNRFRGGESASERADYDSSGQPGPIQQLAALRIAFEWAQAVSQPHLARREDRSGRRMSRFLGQPSSITVGWQWTKDD